MVIFKKTFYDKETINFILCQEAVLSESGSVFCDSGDCDLPSIHVHSEASNIQDDLYDL